MKRQGAGFDADELAALHAAGWKPDAGEAACPDPSLLLAADAGVLDDDALSRVRTHVASCETCKVLAADLGELLDEEPTEAERDRIAARVRSVPLSHRPARSRLYWGITTAGLLSAAAMAGFFAVTLRNVGPLQMQGPTGPRGTGVTAAPTVFTADRPSIPRPEPELTLRGEAAPVPLLEQIGGALDVADTGDTNGAIAGLSDIVRREPLSAEAHLALGATLLRADRVADALPALDRARTLAGKSASDELDWFLASAVARSGDQARAISLLEPLCRRNTLRGALACAGVVEVRQKQIR